MFEKLFQAATITLLISVLSGHGAAIGARFITAYRLQQVNASDTSFPTPFTPASNPGYQ